MSSRLFAAIVAGVLVTFVVTVAWTIVLVHSTALGWFTRSSGAWSATRLGQEVIVPFAAGLVAAAIAAATTRR